MVDSPCVNACAVADGMCVGCGRTLNEITSWQSMSEASRTEVLEEIQGGEREYPKSG
ncbi:DUF1289 domain-containing protein [Haloarcula laminariae]|uniref:DUF1289 domain-containing protein n=1 Tax=Haloarcula laminariae TaxID=2961577 RepID=UPI0021C78263|nr:DUF1289 domain-containing protein [Halomicroarcula laminariae]